MVDDDNTDYYELLGIQITATDGDIKKAYRKKALTVHPDKNPSPDAAILFHKLNQAQEILMDVQKRAAYDNLYRARLERKKKQQEMDSKRRQAQEELEARENKAKKARMEQEQMVAQREAELARLRAERERKQQEDIEFAEREKKRREEEEKVPVVEDIDLALKFKWKKKKYPLSTQDLEQLLKPLGATDVAALTEKRKGHTMVVFNTVVDAHAVMTSKDTNPSLSIFETIDWASGHEPAIITKMKKDEERRKQLAAARMENDARTMSSTTSSASKPLFKTGQQSSFFKNIKIPSPMVINIYI
ncbi:uncharacterized protein BX664DRAFT_364906 [Halteromyces radiatus]|uniref:uncharacterized protein n=1 Tax=Halteromyces radiatus TaxID=101107 RepID=UPI00221E58C1|nr:uncharacterized protein BX664DRAFT_364906 [Halteromyces radiatus]KAI8093356.1 hypothetical protein BX664DRAFT_364906 [Halteromyces radiatus]